MVPLQLDVVAFVPLHTVPQALQFEVDVIDVSHPFVSGAVFTQSAKPGSHPE